MGEGNRVRYLYVEEVTPGTTPATPTMTEIVRTGGSLKGSYDTQVSNRIRSDRMRQKTYRTGKKVAGSFEFEMAYGQQDDLLEGGLANDWTAAAAISGVDLDAVASDDSYNRASGSFISDGLVAGMWILAAGFTNAANNGYKKIVSVAALKVTVAQALTDEASAAGRTLRNDGMLRNGTTAKSYSMEQGHLDLNHFFQFVGMRIGSFSLSMSGGQLITGSMNLEGLSFGVPTGSTVANSINAANTNDVYNAAADIAAVYEGGVASPLSEDVTELSFEINNTLRRRTKLGQLASAAIKDGTQDVTGSLAYYLGASTTLLAKGINFTTSELAVRLTNGAADRTEIWSFPALEYTGDVTPDPGGLDGDVMQTQAFTAHANAASGGYQVQVDRISAP